MLAVGLLILAVVLLRVMQEFGERWDVIGFGGCRFPFTARKPRLNLLQQPFVSVWILEGCKREVGLVPGVAPADAAVAGIIEGKPREVKKLAHFCAAPN